MPEKRVGITGFGKYLPEKRLTNADLEKMVDTSDEWITTRTGIKERRIAKENESTSDMAVSAAKNALKKANLKPKDINLIIVATITPDMMFPATACLVQDKLGASGVPAFDINAACSGFIYGITVANQFIKAGTYKRVLLIGAEKMSSVTDWKDRATCVLLGDGAGAVILEEVKEGGILSTYIGANGSAADLLNMPAGGSCLPASQATVEKRLHFLKMEGNELFKHAVKSMVEASEKAMVPLGLKPEDIKLVIPHQANTRILNAVGKRMGIDLEKQLYSNIELYGNTSGASIAIALVDAIEEGRIKKGDKVLFNAFGAGLTWGAVVIEW